MQPRTRLPGPRSRRRDGAGNALHSWRVCRPGNRTPPCPVRRRIDRRGLPMHHVGMQGIFDVGAGIRKAEQPLGIRFVLGKQTGWSVTARQCVGLQTEAAKRGVLGQDCGRASACQVRLGPVSFTATPPGPGIAKPQRRQEMQRSPSPAPRFATVMWMRMSFGDALAYSTNTSK